MAYASRALSQPESNYGIMEVETLAVIWALSHFKTYLYGQKVKVITDHTAVKSVLLNPAASGKHVRWWVRVFGSGIADVNICYRKGCENSNADALSSAPCEDPSVIEDTLEAAVFHTCGCHDIGQLLLAETIDMSNVCSSMGEEQRIDLQLREVMALVEKGVLLSDESRAPKLVLQANQFVVIDDILYYVDPKHEELSCLSTLGTPCWN